LIPEPESEKKEGMGAHIAATRYFKKEQKWQSVAFLVLSG